MAKTCPKSIDELMECICEGVITSYEMLQEQLQASNLSSAEKQGLIDYFYTVQAAKCVDPPEADIEDCDGNITTVEAQAVAVQGVVTVKNCVDPIDYEYITTPALCINDTWQYQIITKEDGVTTNTENVGTGISCDEPMPVDVEVVTKRRCDLVTNTIWEQPVIYTPSDVEDATTTVEVSVAPEYDTGISCEDLIQDVDVIDCAGVITSERAVPVAIKGTSSVRDCNSDALLAAELAGNALLQDILDKTEDDDTDDDVRVEVVDTGCKLVDTSGDVISGWKVYDELKYDETGNLLSTDQIYLLDGVEAPLPALLTVQCEFAEAVKVDDIITDCYTDGNGNYKKGVKLISYADPLAPAILNTVEEDGITPLDTNTWSVEADKSNCSDCACG